MTRCIDVSQLMWRKPSAKIENLILNLKPVVKGETPLAMPEGGHAASRHVCVHWGATDWNDIYNDYHYTIVFDPETRKAYVVKGLNDEQKGQHLWGRNSGCYGVGFAAMRDATPKAGMTAVQFKGPNPIQPEQMELAAQLIAELCAWKKMNPFAEVTLMDKKRGGDSLVNTGGTMQAPTVADHAWFARQDGYPYDRWDIADYFPTLKARVDTMFRELKGQKMPDGKARAFEFEEVLK